MGETPFSLLKFATKFADYSAADIICGIWYAKVFEPELWCIVG